MAQEVMSTALLMIATIIATVALVNAVFPSIYGTVGSISTVTNTVNDRMKTDMRIVYETATVDTPTLTVWIKNTGKVEVAGSSIEYSDVFFGDGTGPLTRATYDAGANMWVYEIENDDGDGFWGYGETIKVTITAADNFAAGDHRVRMVLYNGVYCEDAFTL